MAMLLKIHKDNPGVRNIKQAAECLQKGGVIIYPTDTIYGLGCNIYNTAAIERICRIKGINPAKAQFSFICRDLSHLSDYSRSVDTPVFRLLKAALPGPYTFILKASKEVPKLLKTRKETVGIRIPDNKICMALIEELGHPIMSVSLPADDNVAYYTNPELMYEKFEKLVDIVIDGGTGGTVSSTVIDCTGGAPELIREGAGDWKALLS